SIVVILVVGGTLAVYLNYTKTASSSTNASNSDPIAQTISIGNGTFSLSGSAHHAYNFTIPAARYNIHLSGNYNLTSGSSLDVLLMDEQQWSTWIAGPTTNNNSTIGSNSTAHYTYYYESGERASGSLDLTFPTTTSDCSYY